MAIPLGVKLFFETRDNRGTSSCATDKGTKWRPGDTSCQPHPTPRPPRQRCTPTPRMLAGEPWRRRANLTENKEVRGRKPAAIRPHDPRHGQAQPGESTRRAERGKLEANNPPPTPPPPTGAYQPLGTLTGKPRNRGVHLKGGRGREGGRTR